MTTPDPAKPRETPLRGVHDRLGASMTEFAGWLMPLRYRSETAEHQAVRTAAGLFDLSHMGEISVARPGRGGRPGLRAGRSLVRGAARPRPVHDDLRGGRRHPGRPDRVPAGRPRSSWSWRTRPTPGWCWPRSPSGRPGHDAQVTDQTADYALIAIQGPAAAGILGPLASVPLDGVRYYASQPATVAGRGILLARTGYTGEDGFELFTAPRDAEHIWSALAAAGAGAGLVPAGLAARDTLRLEAGMPLYGNELGPAITPFDAGLGRVVKLDKPGDFVGRDALAAAAQAAPRRVLVGLLGGTRRVPRHGYPVLWDGQPRGEVTSGAPSPTLGVPIAMAYLEPAAASAAATAASGLAVDIRGRAEPARLTPLPFYHRTSSRT